MVDVTPSRLEIVPAKPRPVHRARESTPARRDEAQIAPARKEEEALTQGVPHNYRGVQRSGYQMPGSSVSLLATETPPSWFEPQATLEYRQSMWGGLDSAYKNRLLAQRPGATLRTPETACEETLWEQYHFLKALTVRLDVGLGTERDRAMFEAGLREYNANYDRIRAQRKARADGIADPRQARVAWLREHSR